MEGASRTARRVATFDTWFPRIVRALAAMIGLTLAAIEPLLDHNDRPELYLFAAVLIGIPGAGVAEKLVTNAGLTWRPAPSSSRTDSEEPPSESAVAPIPSAGTQNGHPPTQPKV